MSRYIDAEHLMEKVSRMIDFCEKHKVSGLNALFQVGDAIMDCPTADVVEVRRGEWRDRYGEKYANRLYECSLCEEIAPEGTVYDELERPLRQQILSPYCPNCGAIMDGERREQNGG